jgi:hypothetical protein
LLFGHPSKEDTFPILTETIKGEKAQAPVDLGRYCYTSQTNKAASVRHSKIKKAASKFQMHAPKEKRGIYKKGTKRTFQIIFSVSGLDIINCI